MSLIKTVIFDLGNVLVPFQPERGYTAFSAATGLSANEIAARLQKSTVYRDYESGQLSTAQFHAAMQDLLQIHVDLATLRVAWSAIFLPETATSEELIKALKRRYRLVLLSNTNELHFEWLRKHYPLLDHFDAFTLSHEVQAMKPDSRIYEAALANAQCEASECFYTDDIRAYVEAARAHGIRAEQFTDEASLKTHLTKHGIVF